VGDTKKCPFCAEDIAVTAKKCRFCNEWLDRSGGSSSKLSWNGDSLLVPEKARLPLAACWICGGGKEVAPKTKRFVYTPPWVYLGVLGGIIPLVILAVVFQKRATLALPLCSSCKGRWFMADLAMGLFGFVGFFGVPALFAVLGNMIDSQNGVAIGIVLGIIGWLVGLVLLKVLYANRVQIIATFVENQTATLKLPDPRVTRQALEGQEKD